MVTEADLSDVGTVNDVQTALGDPDGTTYDQAVVERQLTRARIIVANVASDSASAGQLKEAVIAVAAYGTATASPMETQKEALDVRKDINVEAYIESLKEDKENALNDVQDGAATFEVY